MKKRIKTLLLSVLTEKNAIITEEIGICSIAAYLRKENFDVELINSSRKYLDLERIYEMKPDLIGLPVYSTTEKVVYEVCKKIKEKVPNTKICFGAYWPTLCGDILMEKYPMVDFIIKGEGEIVFKNLVTAMENDSGYSNVKGLLYRDGDKIIENEREALIEDLDSLPFPERDLLRNNMLKYAYISTSRGCKANCSFCWHNDFWGTNGKNQWRGRSPENVVREVKQIVDEYNVNRFWFIDDSFEDCNKSCPNRMWEIAEKIIENNLHISYETYFRAEVYKQFDEKKIKLLKDSGFVGTIFGIESGNAEDLKLYNKPATAEDNYNTIKYFRDNDIAIDIGFINFNPYSTIKRLSENVDYLEKTCFASVLYYLVERCGITKFSNIYYKVKGDGLIINDDIDSCHSYRYVDEDVGKLSVYLYFKYHENENSKEYFYSKKIGSYIREEFKLLNHIKRQFPEFLSTIKAHEDYAWEVLHKVNKNNAKCFRELLSMTEGGWNKDKADKITEEYWNLKYFKSTSDDLERNRLSLYLKLNKAGIEPQQYFNI